MSQIFISYARSTEGQAERIAEALRALGHEVWRDEALPAHRAYAEVIEERLKAASAVVVVWSADAVRSQWVRAEADFAREAGTLVQLRVDGSSPPLPFNQIQCADLTGWTGDSEAPGWRKVVASITELAGRAAPAATSAPPPLPSKPSIAVLPFANVSADPDQEYFVDGMLLEIVEALSRIKSIFVIASGSSLSLKGKGVTAQDAASRLGVRYVLEGSVRKAAGRVRIGVQLIDAEDGAPLWTERFEDAFEDVFALQDRVALAVAGRIEPALAHAESRRAFRRPTENMGSYDLYLRAFAIGRPPERDELLRALDHLNRALELDPDFGPALGWAALAHWLVVVFGWSRDPADDLRQSVELTHRALKAAPDDPYIISQVVQIVAYAEKDLERAIALIDRALALNPGSAAAWFVSSNLRLAAGSPDLAIAHVETSMRLDPLGPDRPLQILSLGAARFTQRRFGEALACFKELARQQPQNPAGHLFVAMTCAHLGQPDAASAALGEYRAVTPITASDFLQRFILSTSTETLELWREGVALAEAGGRPGETG